MPEPENEIIQLSMKFRAALLKRDEAALSRLVATYQNLYKRLGDKIDKLVDAIALEEPTRGQLVRMSRYRQLMAQIRGELGQYEAVVRAELEQIGAAGIEAGIIDSRRMVQFLADGYGIEAGFNNLPTDAIETLLGFLQEDGPLYKRLGELAPQTTNRVADALLEGVGLGYGPGKTARDIVRQQLGMGLTDAMRMVRTTQLWSYREASRASYIANDHIVQGWIWHAQLDGTTCMSCIAQHGSEHPLTETLNDHHNGRCAMIPIVPGMDKDFVVPQTGEEWFESLPEAQQRKQMGAHFHQAYQGGAFGIGDMTKVTENDVFGKMRVQTPLWELLGAEPPARSHN